MRFVDEYRDKEQVRSLVRAIRQVVTRPWHIMEICGGQTHAIARYRLEEMLPEEVKLLHGPGCPVCVTPVGIIDRALELAKRPDVILASFGDMMRVPGSREDLLQIKARGAISVYCIHHWMPLAWLPIILTRKSYSLRSVLKRPLPYI